MTPQAMLGAARLPLPAIFVAFAVNAAGAQEIDLDVPYVPTPEKVVEKMLDLAEVKEGDHVIDLGSGDGRIAIAAAKRGARAYGVDIDPQRVKESLENAKAAGVADRTTFREQDLFDTNISEADVITMYLLPSVNRDLRPRILDLKPGTRVVSHAFDMGEWEADERADVDGRQVYFWRVPAKVDGAWTVEHGGETIRVTFNQRFQKLNGTAQMGEGSVPVNGEVKADVVTFSIGEGDQQRTYSGRLNGTQLEPVASEGSVENWSARRG